MKRNIHILLLVLVLFFGALKVQAEPKPNLIPYPKSLVLGTGSYILNYTTALFYDKKSEKAANLLKEIVQKRYGIELNMILYDVEAVYRYRTIIVCATDTLESKQGAYHISVSLDRIDISAHDESGFFSAIETLRQLMSEGEKMEIPVLEISDRPAFQWRGMLLDASRHSFPKETIKDYIDYLAYYKFNVLHFHITDDQGWRIEIKKYPKLTEIGSWRIEPEGSSYGGFYSQADIREVVKYAESRGITVVPEIEMPGHASAALAAYPDFSCAKAKINVANGWGVFDDVFCAGNDSTFTFLENILSEVIELFPSEYIHIGGDECPKTRWEVCPKCSQRIQEFGLKDYSQLQSYFIKRIEKFLNSKGKKLIGWDEILEGGINPSSTAQVWRDSRYAKDAAKAGCNVIMSPTSYCYFDNSVETHDLKNVYSHSVIPNDFPAELKRHIIGGECALWAEHIPEKSALDYRTFPRLLAMSEDLWNGDAKTSWEDFKTRVESEYPRLRKMGVNPGPDGAAYSMDFAFENGTYHAKINETIKELEYHFTLDGSKPNLASAKVQKLELSFSDAKAFRLQGFKDGNSFGPELGVTGKFVKHKALGSRAQFICAPSPNYSGASANNLTDGIKGSSDCHDGLWQGWLGKDMTAIVDLGSEQEISYLALGALQNSNSWIYFPYLVLFEASIDGIEYKNLGSVINETSYRIPGTFVRDFVLKTSPCKYRYIRATAKSIMVNPEWHSNKFQPCWLFIDELIVR